MKKNILRLFSALTIICVLSVSAFAAPGLVNPGVDSGEVPEDEPKQVLSGEGTSDNPYVIKSAEEFLLAAKMVETDNAQYGADVYSIESCIDFDGVYFVPLGNEKVPFKGTLLGNGHVLKNIPITDIPVFGVVGCMTSGSVKNVHAVFKSDEYTLNSLSRFGGIVGEIHTQSGSTAVDIGGCSVTGEVTINTEKALIWGGVVGVIDADGADVVITDSASYIDFVLSTSSDGYIGGFAGKCEAGTGYVFEMKNCISTGDICTTKAKTGIYVSGFAGFVNKDENGWSGWTEEDATLFASSNALFENCFATGNVTSLGFGGKLIAYLGTFITSTKMYYSSSQTLTSLYTTSAGKSCSASNLKSSTYLSSTLGFDMTNKWTLSEDGTLLHKGKCSECMLAVFEITSDGVNVANMTGEYTLVVSDFKENVLQSVKFVPVSGEISVSFEELGIDTAEADYIKAFLFEADTIKPVRNSKTISFEE